MSHIRNTCSVISSEAPITFCQPGLAGTKHDSVMEGGDPPYIKGLDTVLPIIQKAEVPVLSSRANCLSLGPSLTVHREEQKLILAHLQTVD